MYFLPTDHMSHPNKRKNDNHSNGIKRQRMEEDDDDQIEQTVMAAMRAQVDADEEDEENEFFNIGEGDEGDEGDGTNPMIGSLMAMTKLTYLVDKELKAIGVDMDQEGDLVFPEDFDREAFCVKVSTLSNSSPMMVESILEALKHGPADVDLDDNEDDEDIFEGLILDENEDDEDQE